MLYIKIKNNITDEVKDIEKDLEWLGDFIWSEGNFSCDCNRDIFFNGDSPDDFECSDNIYTILSIHNNDELVYSET